MVFVKGHKPSEEMKRKMSESRKRTWANPELRKRMSDAHKGQIAWNKDIPASEESKQKHSVFMKEYYRTHKHPMKGKIFTTEQRMNVSVAQKKRFANPEENKKISETRKVRINEGKIKIWNKGKTGLYSEEYLKRMRESRNKPEAIKRSREQMIKRIEEGKYSKISHTLSERMLKDEIKRRDFKEGEDFIHQYNLYGIFVCDFCFPTQKVIIEVDGDFYHRNPIKYAGKKIYEKQRKSLLTDKRKEAYVKVIDNGSWTLLRFWESDIKKDVAGCVDKVVEVLKSKAMNKINSVNT